MSLQLKLAIVAASIKHQALAAEVNRRLDPAQHISELDVTKLVTGRKHPTPEQAAAIGSVLGHSTIELFPGEVAHD